MKADFNSRIKQTRIRWRINDAVTHVMLWPKPLIERISPSGSSFRRYYGLAITGLQIMILYGWESFWRRYRHFSRTEKNVAGWHSELQCATDQRRLFKITPDEFIPLEKQKVAVVIHAYYPDLFPEICTYLKNMPCPYTLLISARNDEDVQVINRQVAGLPMLAKTVVKVVENRGRDIAPFLVDFASEVAGFDYICKIHTKKSLFTGSERMEWRQYLYKMLLGSKERVQAILTLFAGDESVGIIYPVRSDCLPYWAYTWLSNKWLAAPVVNRLGFDFDPDEYIDYPAGSMFWIKKEALKPLLDMRFKEDDFPEERGQNDSAVQHVIERCFVLSAQSRGLKFAQINELGENIFSFSGANKVAPYFSLSFADQVRIALPKVDVVSFDIFDTLLCRPFATPDKLFQYLDELVAQKYGIKNFMQLRKRAEGELRMHLGPIGDVKISHIYTEFAGLARISHALAGEILELELSTEIDLLIPRQGMIDSFEQVIKAGKRVVLTTDTYFEKPHIERILKAKGIQGYHALYISCEEGRRKDRGDMWDYMLCKEGIQEHRFLHVGDNEQSDIQLLGDRGAYFIVHVMKPSVLFRQSAHGRLLWQMLNPGKGWRENLLYGMIGNHFCLDPYPYEFWYQERPLSDPFALGYTVFGPLMHNFLAWLINCAKLDGVTRLSFLSREGYILQKMYEQIAGSAALKEAGMALPSSDYFLCSRRAALFAGLQKPEDLLPFLDRDFSGTLKDFFEKRLNVSTSNMQSIEDILGKDTLNKPVALPTDYEKVKGVLLSVFEILTPQAAAEREALVAYCRDRGMKGNARTGLVDIGYSCTIQRSLINLLGMPLNGYYFAIDERAGKITERNSVARGYLGELINPATTAVVIFNYALLLESVLTSPQGQLLYFSREKDGIMPVFRQPGLSQKHFDVISRVHEGMSAFVRDMVSLFGARLLEIEFPVSDLLHYYQMIATGQVDIGDLKAALSVEDEYSGLSEIAVIDYYSSSSERETGKPRQAQPARQSSND